MFGLQKLGWMALLKGLAVVAVLSGVTGTIYAGYEYITGLQEAKEALAADNATLKANELQLEQAILEQNATIEALQEDMRELERINAATNADFQDARDRVAALERKFSEHNLGYLAANRPGLVEGVINNASDSVARCFEIASGSPLTDAERNATLPSQINRECPELANPNYRGN